MRALKVSKPRFAPRFALASALEPFAVAAMRGQYELLLAEVERAVARLFPTTQPRALVRPGGAWHEWSTLEHGADTGIDTPAGMESWDAPRPRFGWLIQTLRVFFDVNCSHEAASQRLGVHRKTIAHRLAKISELSGLDLTTHDDRLVADLSLYVYRMLLDDQKTP